LIQVFAVSHGIELTRSRPYRKNDQAWIEQTNDAVVRKLLGYRRFATVRVVVTSGIPENAMIQLRAVAAALDPLKLLEEIFLRISRESMVGRCRPDQLPGVIAKTRAAPFPLYGVRPSIRVQRH